MIPVVTLHEPWATLMFVARRDDRKHIETRNWQPIISGKPYRGPLVIHAGRTMDEHICRNEPFLTVLKHHFRTWDFLGRFKLGHILGTVELMDVQRTEVLAPTLSFVERAFGNYEPERFGWICDYAIPLPTPIPARGKQKLWFLTEEQEREIVRQTPMCGFAP